MAATYPSCKAKIICLLCCFGQTFSWVCR